MTSLAAPVRRKVTASAVTSSGVRHGTKLVGSQLGEGGLEANTQASLDAKSGYFVSNSNEVKRGQNHKALGGLVCIMLAMNYKACRRLFC